MATDGSTYSKSKNNISEYVVYLILFLASASFPYFSTQYNIKLSLIVVVVIIALPMIFYVITDLKFGVIVLVIYSFLLPAIGRFVIKGFPEGTILDGLLLLMLV
jgi:cytochrome c oxidase subunit IV